ncbi:hypothetical protein QE367_001889 [Microbacterium paludicola]|uniref:Uncharacterized protein n=1 Tax=Microbacterium paludicola TaxID=300019 RepID=A0ABU1I1V3_9MICO|nr:hypothetical protein [Microbacterium paludicola]MDR6167685.1 hypothetical protein [Microbacterium paludicola]
MSSGAGSGSTVEARASTTPDPAGTSSSPGFVHSCPALPVTEATNCSAISALRPAAAPRVTNAGFTLPSSP